MKQILQFLLLLICINCNINVKAEGTKELSPSESNLTGLATLVSQGGGSYLNCPEDNRIYFRIQDFNTERFYFGLRPHHYNTFFGRNSSWCGDSIYVKVYNPSGTVIFQQRLDTTVGAAGFINTYAQATAGPNIGGLVPTGYNPITITPTVNGNFWIEMYYSQDGGVTMAPNATSTNTNAWLKMPYFDFTVATAANTRFPGRVHCDKWNVVAITNAASQCAGGTFTSTSTQSRFEPNGNASSEGVYFAYTTDSVVIKVDFEQGFRPIAYNVAVNNYGVTNGGNWLADRRSINSATAPSLANGYKIFLNDPDIAIYPSGIIPGSASFPEPTMKGCPPTGPYRLRYKIPAAADVVILLDINGVAGYQPATTDRVIEQPSRLAGLNTYVWDGLNGLGAQVPAGSTLNFSVSTYFQKGKASVPLYDAEINKAGFKMVGVRPVATSALRMFWDDSQLTNVGACGTTPANTNAQNNLTGIGINNALFGTAAPSHAWSGTGNLSNVVPAPNAFYCTSTIVNDSIHPTQYQWDDFGNVRVINTWSYGIESFITKSIKLLCVNVTGTVFNDVDGSAAGTFGGIQNGSETGTNGGTLYAALVDPETNEVIGYGTVAANGTYTINGVPVNSTGLKLIITSTLPVVDAVAPAEATPTGYANTSPLINTINTAEVDINNLNFGINRLPESAFNNQPNQNNPTSTDNVTIPSSAFNINNVGATPNTQDYDGGTINNIRITAFPSNVTSIRIGTVTYYPNAGSIPGTCPTATCLAWPGGGVLVPFTNGTGITPNMSIDPIDGLVVVVIPFVAVDNSGVEDPTPGSVSIPFTTVLNVKYTNFNVVKYNNKAELQFKISQPAPNSTFTIERNINGNTFNAIGSILGTNATTYNYVDNLPVLDIKNYYRIKELDANGEIIYSEIRWVNFGKNKGVEVYPIPALSVLNINVGAEFANKQLIIRLYNGYGQEVLQKQIKSADVIESIVVSNFATGIYKLIVTTNNETVVNKTILITK